MDDNQIGFLNITTFLYKFFTLNVGVYMSETREVSVELLSEKERALYDKIVEGEPLELESLNSSEVGTLGRLKFLGVEIFKNRQKEDTPLRYMAKYVRFKPEPVTLVVTNVVKDDDTTIIEAEEIVEE